MFKKILSVILALVISAAVLIPSFSVLATEECDCGNSPIIYIIGRTDIFDHPESPDRKVIPSLSADNLLPAVKDLIPYGAKAVFLNQWKTFNQKTMETLMPYFEGYAINPDGTVTNGTGITFSWSEDRISKNHNSNNPYTYRYEYDARISPMVIADDLNNFIEAVKRTTNHSKVSIICRCVGANYAFAYLYKYQEPQNYAGLDRLVIYNAALNGVELMEDAFSGNTDCTGRVTDAGQASICHVAINRRNGDAEHLCRFFARVRFLRTGVLLGSRGLTILVVGFDCFQQFCCGQARNIGRQYSRRGIQDFGRHFCCRSHYRTPHVVLLRT